MNQLPDLLTLLRILAILPICFLIPLPGVLPSALATLIYLLAILTDFFDGFLARKFGTHSKFGEVMDPVADKMLVTAVILVLVATGEISTISTIAALIIILREIFVSGLRDFISRSGGSLPVSKLAKWKTSIQMIALLSLIMSDATKQTSGWLGEILLWIAMILALVTGWDYCRKLFKENFNPK